MKRMIEVCCGSYEDALQAHLGGADRIELNSALHLGGLTPSTGTLKLTKAAVSIPVIAMVRPRGAGFCYSEKEAEVMMAEAKELLEAGETFDEVLAIGPVPMMKFVCKTTEPYGVHTSVSLNPIMIDGTGMCGGCRVTVGGETKFACVDGPEFDGHKVDFAELMSRNNTYRDREAEVSKTHTCRMEAMGKALIK